MAVLRAVFSTAGDRVATRWAIIREVSAGEHRVVELIAAERAEIDRRVAAGMYDAHSFIQEDPHEDARDPNLGRANVRRALYGVGDRYAPAAAERNRMVQRAAFVPSREQRRDALLRELAQRTGADASALDD